MTHTLLHCFFLVLACFITSATRPTPTVDRKEARDAYALLNHIRQHPEHYRQTLLLNPNEALTKTALRWNDTLARVAEARAYDMAARDYFSHVDPDGYGPNYHIHRAGYRLNADWLVKRTANNFESIAANYPDAQEGIRALIVGRGQPTKHHRKHLLGMDKWNHSLTDIGIGYVRMPSGSVYKSYLCVTIAKHDW